MRPKYQDRNEEIKKGARRFARLPFSKGPPSKSLPYTPRTMHFLETSCQAKPAPRKALDRCCLSVRLIGSHNSFRLYRNRPHLDWLVGTRRDIEIPCPHRRLICCLLSMPSSKGYFCYSGASCGRTSKSRFDDVRRVFRQRRA
jgi:hypothetical protein